MTRNPLIPQRKRFRRSGGGKAAALLKERQSNIPTVTVENAAIRLATFIKYYKAIELIPEIEWDDFIATSLTCVPVAFRFSRLHRLSNISMEGRKGTQSQPEVLLDIFKKTLLPDLQEQLMGKKQVTVTPLPWYQPKGYAWQTNFDAIEFRKYAGLKDFADFIIDETLGFNVLRQDVHLMLPPMLIEIKPEHKVLDMCAAPGFMSAAALECLYANPKKLPDGFLVANDIQTNHIQWRWTQGTNCIFLGHDAKYLPEMYLSEEHTDENRLRYDRVLLDPPCSNDGNFRKSAQLKIDWKPNKCLEHHKDQKLLLQRGLELLAVGGELLYTTTSMHPVENEAVVAALLRMAPDSLELVDPRDRVPGFISRPGMSNWKIMNSKEEFYDTAEEAPEWLTKIQDDTIFQPSDAENEVFQLERCMRVLPHDNNTTAFFCAVIRKIADIPWEPAVPEVTSTEAVDINPKPVWTMEELLKERYIWPIHVCTGIHVAKMEWTTEVTNAKLETTSTTSLETYDRPPLVVSDRSLNMRVKQELMKVKSYLSHDDEDWKKLKSFYKLSNAISPSMIIKRNGGRARTTVYYFMHPNIKKISESNTQLCSPDHGLKNFGLKAFRIYEHELSPHCNMVVSDIGLMGILPFLGARVVNVTKEDVVKLIQQQVLTFDELSPKVRKAVEAIEPGCLVYYYKADGKKADPNCDIAFVGWRNKSHVKSHIDQMNDIHHMLRLCGAEDTGRKERYNSNLLPVRTVTSEAAGDEDAAMLEDADDDDIAVDDDVLMQDDDA